MMKDTGFGEKWRQAHLRPPILIVGKNYTIHVNENPNSKYKEGKPIFHFYYTVSMCFIQYYYCFKSLVYR